MDAGTEYAGTEETVGQKTVGRKTVGRKTLGRKTLDESFARTANSGLSLDGRKEPHLLEYLIYHYHFLSKHENCSCEFLPCYLFYSSTHFKFYLFFVFLIILRTQ